MMLLTEIAEIATGIVVIIMCIIGAIVGLKFVKGIIKFVVEIVCLAAFIIAILLLCGVI